MHADPHFNDNFPTVGQSITSSSGGSGTISAVTIGHQLGGIRVAPLGPTSLVEAVTFDRIDCLGGLYSFTCASLSGSVGRAGNMAFCRIADSVYFDTPYKGALIEGAYGCIFDCWFANARETSGVGAYFIKTGKTRIRGHFVANCGWGAVFDPTCIYTTIDGADFDGNCRRHAGQTNMAELLLNGAIQRVTLANMHIGFTGANGINPPKAIYMDATGSNWIKASNIQCPAGSITWGSTGPNNRRNAVDGLSDL